MKKKIQIFSFFLLVACLLLCMFGIAQEEIFLWENGIPGAIKKIDYEEVEHLNDDGSLRGYSKVSEPTLTIFIPKYVPNGAAVVICPGGGYSHLAIDKEGYKVAEWLNSLGVTAFVLKYRLPSDEIMEDKRIGPLQDAQDAIRFVRANAI